MDGTDKAIHSLTAARCSSRAVERADEIDPMTPFTRLLKMNALHGLSDASSTMPSRRASRLSDKKPRAYHACLPSSRAGGDENCAAAIGRHNDSGLRRVACPPTVETSRQMRLEINSVRGALRMRQEGAVYVFSMKLHFISTDRPCAVFASVDRYWFAVEYREACTKMIYIIYVTHHL